MVAYSFQRMFGPDLRAGRKLHTIRGARRRHARVGEEVQLYHGMRTKHCELIGRAICDRFRGVYLKFSEWQSFALFDVIELEPGHWRRHGPLEPIADPEAFAHSDGFPGGIEQMAKFWLDQHGVRSFSGYLIGWPCISLRPAMSVPD